MKIVAVILQSLLSLAVLFLLARLTGKRSIAQLNAFDYVNSITIGSITAELATDLEQWPLPLTAMLVYGLFTALINWGTCKSMALRKWVNGKPLILYENDTLNKENLLKAKLDINEFLTQARLAGYFDLQQVQCAVMENNGQVSFLPKALHRPATPQDMALSPADETLFVSLIFDGKVLQANLKDFGKNMDWLRSQLHAAGIGQISEVFFACCDESGNFRACRQPGETGQKQRAVFEQ